jgi:hypothetical protein
MARLRCRMSPALRDFHDPRAELTLRRLLGTPNHEFVHRGRSGGRTYWLEFTDLTDSQIEGYIGLFRSYGVPEGALEVAGAKATNTPQETFP